jgi:hypothetical protein
MSEACCTQEVRNAYKFFYRKPERKRPPERLSTIVKRILNKYSVNWVHMDQHRFWQ